MGESPRAGASSDALAIIEEAYQRRDALAVRHQGRRVSFARFAVLLGPLAVFLLAVQTVAYPTDEKVGVALIALELTALGIAVLLGYFEIGGSHYHWIRERVRAELIRRDRFLLTARAGPYLSVPDSLLAERVRDRLREIDSEFEDPVEFLMKDVNETTWRFALEDVDPREQLPVEPLSAVLQQYFDERVESQRVWFEHKSHEHGRFAGLLERFSRALLVIATVLSAAHLYLLAQKNHDEVVVAIAALTLPALAAAIVALQCVFGSRHLDRSYGLAARSLTRVASHLENLRAELQAGIGPSPAMHFRFKRIVLETEHIIADDLRRWWLVVYPEAPRAGA